MFLCLHICVHVCVYICECVCVCMYIYKFLLVYIYIYIYMSIRMCLCVRFHFLPLVINGSIFSSLFLYIRNNTLHSAIKKNSLSHTHTNTHIYIYIHKHVHAHTHTHTHIHTYTYAHLAGKFPNFTALQVRKTNRNVQVIFKNLACGTD